MVKSTDNIGTNIATITKIIIAFANLFLLLFLDILPTFSIL